MPGYRQNAEVFLRGMRSNGILVFDSREQLKERLRAQVKNLPITFGQRLVKLLEELLKDPRRTVQIPAPEHPQNGIGNSLCNMQALACLAQADGLVTGDDGAKSKPDTTPPGVEQVALNDYLDSSFEARRSQYLDGMPPLDKMKSSDCDEMFRRILRFTKWVRFYNKQIGKGTNTSHFRKGIRFVLDFWQKHGYFHGKPGIRPEVVVVTSLKENVKPDDSTQVRQQKAESNRRAIFKVRCELMDVLQQAFPEWSFKLHVKEDEGGLFHARYLESQFGPVLIERGFDLFGPKGKLKSCPVKIDMAAQPTLQELRHLPDAKIS